MKTDDKSPGAPIVSPRAPEDTVPGEKKRQQDPDYEAIYAAVMETARGRWFLDEYARRNRAADTGIVLAAVDRLEGAINKGSRATIPAGRSDIADLTDILTRARSEIAAIAHIGHPEGMGPEQREAVALRAIDAMGRALQQIEHRVHDIASAQLAEPRNETELPDPSVRPGSDAAVGRFLKEIAMVYADDVRWAGEQAGARTNADEDRAAEHTVAPSDKRDESDAAARDAAPGRATSSAPSDLSAHASDPKIVRLR